MSTGYPSAAGLPVPGPAGPPTAPGWPSFAAPSYPPPPLTDHQLQQLPPPAVVPQPGRPTVTPADGTQRPAVVGIAAAMATTASLQWVCALSLVWVTATVGAAELEQQGEQGAIFHILNRFHYRMVEGLAWPLFGFPLLSFVTGFLILSGRPWTRLAHSVVGALLIGWSAWWLRDELAWWVSSTAYVAVACLILWSPAASRWFARPQPRSVTTEAARVS